MFPIGNNRPLPPEFRLDEYRVARLLAGGAFSFVYLAHDRAGREVALKEYFPASLARRLNGSPALAVPEASLGAFRRGLHCFFAESRVLARLRHPNVVSVLNFFRANDTAYLAMRYESGQTLQQAIQAARAPLPEPWLRATFVRLLNGLRAVHARRLLHLDIKPANVYVRSDGSPLLLDFGAVRGALGAERDGLAPVFTPGFASPEHHGPREALGPWSDIYSVGACLYAGLSGEAPQPAAARLQRDELVPARRAWAGKRAAALLELIDRCMSLDALARPQSVLAVQRALAAS